MGRGRQPKSGGRLWPTKFVQFSFTPHKDTHQKLLEIQEITNRTMSAIIRILIDKALGVEPDPRDLASVRDNEPDPNYPRPRTPKV